MNERRQFPRIYYRVAIQYQRGSAPEWGLERAPFPKTAGGCLGMDLSEGGVRFYAEDFFPLQTPITFTIPLPTLRNLALEGRVVWTQRVPHAERYQVAAQFEDSASNRLAKNELVRWLGEFSAKGGPASGGRKGN